MGQKISATGLRIGVNKDWKSMWYAPKDKYGDTAHEDYSIREYIRRELRSAGVDKVVIKRYLSKIEVEIKVARPGVVIGRGGEQIEILKKKLNRLVEGKVEIKVLEVDDPNISAQLIADRIVEQLERRIVPKFIMSKELDKAVNTGKIKGIRIWVAGRIRGAEIARTEKTQWGNLPLQTLKADIDYATSVAQVPNAGRQGVKVWVYVKGKSKEKQSKKDKKS
jgi:small subunit ribosomal protein S3